MTAWRDPQGNAQTFTYDSNLRIVSVAVRVEPVAPVVPLEPSEKRERLVGEAGCRHRRPRLPGRALRLGLGYPFLKLTRQMRDEAEHSLHQHQLTAVVHLVLLRRE
jgi:hypothetical protein